MSASTAPAAKAQLLAMFAARDGLAGVHIDWAAPTKTEGYTGGENVWLGDIDDMQTWGAIARATLPKDEDYTIEFVAQAHREGDDPQATEERAWELVAEIEGALRADPSINGINNREAASLTRVKMTTRPAEPQGWLAKATGQITCHARTRL